MENDSGGTPSNDEKRALQHITEARSLLNDLQSEIDQHPKLADAISKLELALSLLTTKSGGLL
jgi:predicted component of type VI protein secretion system